MPTRTPRSVPLRVLAPIGALLLALAACAPRAGGAGATLRAPEVVILGGAVCRPGDLDGLPQVGWLCDRPATGGEGEAALVEGIELAGTEIVYRRASLTRGDEGAALGAVATVRAEVAEVTLASGERCFAAGRGATVAVDGMRLNYSCEGSDTVLLGDFRRDGAAVLTTRATLERSEGVFELGDLEPVGVTRLAVAN